MELSDIYRQKEGLVARKSGNEYIIVPLSDTVAGMTSLYTLNETGAFIWDQLDGTRDLWQVICLMMEEYEVDEAEALADVVELIEEMDGKVIEALTS